MVKSSSSLGGASLPRRSWAYAVASWKLAAFYFYFVSRFRRIHDDLLSGKLLNRIQSVREGQVLELNLSSAFRKDFNDAYANLQKQLRKLLHFDRGTTCESLIISSFTVRALWACAMWVLPKWALVLGLAQFVFAPMSFVISFLRLLTNASDALFHYVLNAAAAFAIRRAADSVAAASSSGAPQVIVTLDGKFLALFLLADFFLNLVVYFSASKPFGAKKLLKHIAFGTFNTKTYFIVVVGCLSGLEINIWVWLLTGMLTTMFMHSSAAQRTLNLFRIPCFQALFYCEHRLNHCPVVYLHAHKQHHYMHDTTSFDGHIYGSGMNEEFFWILAECLPSTLAPQIFFPYFLNANTLWSSFTNKGGHTRSSLDDNGGASILDFDEECFHADHHTLHNKNFGSSTGIFLDMYFGTAGRDTKGGMGLVYDVKLRENDCMRMEIKRQPLAAKKTL